MQHLNKNNTILQSIYPISKRPKQFGIRRAFGWVQELCQSNPDRNLGKSTAATNLPSKLRQESSQKCRSKKSSSLEQHVADYIYIYIYSDFGKGILGLATEN